MYDIRIRNIVAPRSPTLFRGTAKGAMAWLLNHTRRSDEDLFIEVWARRKGYGGAMWHTLRGRLAEYAEKEVAE